jgi:EAL and modified HD-GYP domain-containing signal transduction protein
MSRFMVARQPIYGANLGVRGYELLFRGPAARTTDGIAMTADVLVRAGLDVGVSGLVGDKRVFVKAPHPFLVGDIDFPLPPRQTVIEIVQDVARTPEVVAGCRRLVQNGFALALDHYVWDDDDDPLLEMVSIIKLDVLTLTLDQLADAVNHNSKFGVELLAEKIETREHLEACRKLGFDLFEGYFLGRPDTIEGDALCPSKVTCLRILEELCHPGTSGREVQDLVQTDPALSYRFLRAAGAGPAAGLFPSLRSVREAVVSLGSRRLRTWVTLMVLASCYQTSDEELGMVIPRARACELTAVALELEPRQVDAAFTVGLLSALDGPLGTPLPAIVDELSVTGEVKDALLDHNGVLGRVLSDVMQREAYPGEHDDPYSLLTAHEEADALPGPKSPTGRFWE